MDILELDREVLIMERRLNLDMMRINHEYMCERDGLYSFITEAQSNDKPGGFIGFVLSIFRKIGEMFQRAINVVAKFLTGKEIAKDKVNEQVHMDKDIGLVSKFISGDIKSSKEYLQKIQSGQVSKEEATRFVQSQDKKWDSIGPSVQTVGALMGAIGVSSGFLVKWKNEADGVYRSLTANDKQKFSSQVAHTRDTSPNQTLKRDVASNGAEQIMAAHIQSSANRGIGVITSCMKNMYQKKYLTQRILDEANEARSKGGFRNMKRRQNAEMRGIRRQIRDEQKIADREDKYFKAMRQGAKKLHNAQDDLRREIGRNYNNTMYVPDRVPTTKPGEIINKVKNVFKGGQ